FERPIALAHVLGLDHAKHVVQGPFLLFCRIDEVRLAHLLESLPEKLLCVPLVRRSRTFLIRMPPKRVVDPPDAPPQKRAAGASHRRTAFLRTDLRRTGGFGRYSAIICRMSSDFDIPAVKARYLTDSSMASSR